MPQQTKDFSFVVLKSGRVAREVRFFDGKNWITTMQRPVADSVADFRKRFPATQLRRSPLAEANESIKAGPDLVNTGVGDLPALLADATLDGLATALSQDDRTTAQALYRKEISSRLKPLMKPKADDSEEGDGD